MQTSMNPADWKEDYHTEQRRWALTRDSFVSEKRALYPFSVRVKQGSRIYNGLQAGTIIHFARTKMVPASFPIEALGWTQSGMRDFYCFTPDEAELIAPVDPPARR